MEGWPVGWSVCHNSLGTREVTLPCSYQSKHLRKQRIIRIYLILMISIYFHFNATLWNKLCSSNIFQTSKFVCPNLRLDSIIAIRLRPKSEVKTKKGYMSAKYLTMSFSSSRFFKLKIAGIFLLISITIYSMIHNSIFSKNGYSIRFGILFSLMLPPKQLY